MSLHPGVRERAQAELHAVVGPNRLPAHADRPNLPYINAIIKESLRWQNAAPLGIPHAVVDDDEYEGYFIPAGTVVFANTWYVKHGLTLSIPYFSYGVTHLYAGQSSTIRKHTRTPNASIRSGS